LNYIDGRRCSSGGYSFYRDTYLEEPNPHDTYYALKTYKLFRVEPPRKERTEDYLNSVLSTSSTLNPVYFSAFGLLLLGAELCLPLLREKFTNIRPPRSLSTREELIYLLRWLRIAALLDQTSFPLHVELPLFKDNLVKLYLSACIAKESRSPLDTNAIEKILWEFEDENFGYTINKYSSLSSLDVQYAGCALSILIERETPYREKVLEFVLMCKDGRGGFSRLPGGIPTLDHTYRGAFIIWNLWR